MSWLNRYEIEKWIDINLIENIHEKTFIYSINEKKLIKYRNKIMVFDGGYNEKYFLIKKNVLIKNDEHIKSLFSMNKYIIQKGLNLSKNNSFRTTRTLNKFSDSRNYISNYISGNLKSMKKIIDGVSVKQREYINKILIRYDFKEHIYTYYYINNLILITHLKNDQKHSFWNYIKKNYFCLGYKNIYINLEKYMFKIYIKNYKLF